MDYYFDGMVSYSDHCGEPVFRGFFTDRLNFRLNCRE